MFFYAKFLVIDFFFLYFYTAPYKTNNYTLLDMKLSDDQKKIVKALAFYPIIYIAITIIYHVIKSDVDWTEIFWNSVLVIVTTIIMVVFFTLGSSIPKK